MLTISAAALVVLILASVVVQRSAVVRYIRFLRRTPRRSPERPPLPKAAVLFPIRGADPELRECLRALATQDYDDYRILVVADDPGDAGLGIVEELRRNAPVDRFDVRILSNPLATCSLKNSCLVEAAAVLDDSYGVVAFIDGDIVPHPRWLADLCAPLVDESIGATTGNRWYVPPAPATWGSLVRRVWNVGAIVQMWLTGIVWAGSMAMRVETLRRSGLCDIWRRSMSTDSVVTDTLRRHGYRTAFVPDAVMPVREDIGLGAFRTWMVRQLLMVLMYHPGWKLMFLQAFSIAGILAGAAALLVVSGAVGAWGHFAAVAVACLLYQAAGVYDVHAVDAALNRRREFVGDEPFAPRPVREQARVPAACLLAMGVFLAALLDACFRRQIRWRGITYEIRSRRNVHMTGFRPFPSKAGAHDLRSVL